jgi:hypothetical protein
MTTAANSRRSVCAGSAPPQRAPASAPTSPPARNTPVTARSMPPKRRWPASPAAALMAMATSDVATASRMGSPAR